MKGMRRSITTCGVLTSGNMVSADLQTSLHPAFYVSLQSQRPRVACFAGNCYRNELNKACSVANRSRAAYECCLLPTFSPLFLLLVLVALALLPPN